MLHKENAVIKAGVTQQTHGGSLYYVVEVPRNEYDDEYDKRRARYDFMENYINLKIFHRLWLAPKCKCNL